MRKNQEFPLHDCRILISRQSPGRPTRNAPVDEQRSVVVATEGLVATLRSQGETRGFLSTGGYSTCRLTSPDVRDCFGRSNAKSRAESGTDVGTEPLKFSALGTKTCDCCKG